MVSPSDKILQFHEALKQAKRLHKDGEHDKAWAEFGKLAQRAFQVFGPVEGYLQVYHVYKAQAVALRREKRFDRALHLDLMSLLARGQWAIAGTDNPAYSLSFSLREIKAKLPAVCKSNKAAGLAKQIAASITEKAKSSQGFDFYDELKAEI